MINQKLTPIALQIAKRIFRALPLDDGQRASLAFAIFRLTGDRLDFLPSYRLYLRDSKWHNAKVPKNLAAYRASVLPQYFERDASKEQVRGKSVPPKNKAMLMVSHTLGGGTEQHVKDLADRLAAEGWQIFYLQRHNKDHLRLVSSVDSDPLFYSWPKERSALVTDLKTLGIMHAHLHHTVDLPADFLAHFAEVTTETELPFDYTVHDYFSICPRFTLFDEAVRGYCGEPEDVRKCSSCVKHLGSAAGKDVDVAKWRAEYGALLASARKVFVPDADVSTRLSRYFPSQIFTLRPHPEKAQRVVTEQGDAAPALGFGEYPHSNKILTEQGNAAKPWSAASPLKIVTIGGIAPHKGSKALLDCAENALGRHLPIHFTLIGYSDIDVKLKALKNVTVTGHFQPQTLTKFLYDGGYHLAFLPSVIPETYNYVLSECWRHGLFTACFDIGAIASRIKAAPHLGTVLPYNWYYQPEKVNDALLSLAIPSLSGNLPLTDYPSVTRDYYGL